MKFKTLVISLFVILFSVLSLSSAIAQKQWSLKECIDYAIENNIQMQQSKLSIQESDIRLNTSKNSRLPSLSASLGGSMSFGRSTSRDGVFIDQTQSSSSFGINLSVPVYEGSRIKYEIRSNEFSLKASMQGYERAKEDLSLSIVSLYMQILFSKELVEIAKNQYELSKEAVKRSKILFENGRVPESDYYESLSLESNDKLSLLDMRNQLSLNLLNLSHALNITNSTNFDILAPNLDSLNFVDIQIQNTSEEIYSIALITRPSILREEILLKKSEQDLKIVKSSYYPRISFGAGYNNGYYYSLTPGEENFNFRHQMSINARQNLGLSISIPIFNKLATRNQTRLAKLSIKSQTLAVQDSKVKLEKEIEQSYQNAQSSYQKYLASHESLKAAKLAFRFEKQKMESGRSTIFDFNDSKTRLIRAESDVVSAKYGFLFNKKILDFYSGKPLEN